MKSMDFGDQTEVIDTQIIGCLCQRQVSADKLDQSISEGLGQIIFQPNISSIKRSKKEIDLFGAICLDQINFLENPVGRTHGICEFNIEKHIW